MAQRPFVHLHCHTHYSLLDGASDIGKLVGRAAEHGMNALAITDHGNLHGALEFYREAKGKGLNPIIGYEAYVAPKSRFLKDAGRLKEAAFHLTLLAKNRQGFKNLLKLASAAYLEGFYFKPRIDRELLESLNEGIICLSGCVSSEFSRALLQGDAESRHFAEACEIAASFQSIFGDRYFIEIQNNGLEIQRQQLAAAVQVANKVGIPLVATSDAHYVDRDDAEAQDVLLCINTGAKRADKDRMQMEGSEFYLRPPEEMYRNFPGLEDAVARSQEIADGVSIELEEGKRHFPVYALPQGKTADELLLELCLLGLKDRYKNDSSKWQGDDLGKDVMDRLERELYVINKLGFPTYFLIVWDFVRYAREKGIEATARGSGVGSLVCYALYLSHVCPLDYDLLFERFLDENRKEAPDIDIDFDKDRRGEVIHYVKEKYGSENVAQIGTFGTLAARAAIRDVGRALGMPIPDVDRVVAMVPEELGISLVDAIDSSPDLKKAFDAEPQVHELLTLAQKIEGLARNVGTHAAAVVIADKPLVEYVPLCRVTGKDDVITQWSMGDVEKAGLLKMDFLGLRNLTILSKAVQLIEQTTGKRVDPYSFPLDDQETFALLCRGETKGIFQLESGGIRDLLQKMKPDSFRDIIATNALYRPGPLEGGMVDDYVQVKHGRKQAQYPHPVMKEVLGETHGVMVYQEQVMRILNRLGGIPLSDSYSCIKAISKKKQEQIDKFSAAFVKGCVEKGLSKEQGNELFGLIAKFAGYGFNKSHSTAYAKIAYMTAYLKAHYPVEFMAALLSGDMQGRNFKKKDQLVEHLEDCRRMDIRVAAPDVNTSCGDFTVHEGTIRFGLLAIKGCGEPAVLAIESARKKDGPFRSIFEFCERVEPQAAGRGAIETLIKAGAFDSLGSGNRAALMSVVERAIQGGVTAHADRKRGQKGLFADVDDKSAPSTGALPSIPDWTERERLAGEKEVLGCYFSSHPLAEHESSLRTFCTHTIDKIPELKHRDEVVLGGVAAALKYSNTKNPRPGSTHTKYVMFDLEDMSGIIRCICWPEQFATHSQLIEADAVLLVRGAIDRRPGTEEANLVVNEVVPLAQAAERFTNLMRIFLDERVHDPSTVERLSELFREFPGRCKVSLVLLFQDGSRLTMDCGLGVSVSPELRSRVDDILGSNFVRFVSEPPKPTPSNKQAWKK